MRWAAFLRGINVGGRRITGDELCAPFEDLELGEVDSYLASGNVVFSTDEPPDGLAARIEAQLAASLGWDVPVFLRDAEQVRTLAAHEPFPAGVVEATDGRLQVAMLRDEPADGTRRTVLAMATDDDRLALTERELWWLPSGGTQESDLDLSAIEDALGPTTMRTHNTIRRLAAKYFGG